MPLGTEVDLDPDDILLDGDPAPPPKSTPSFGPYIIAKQLHGSRCHLGHLSAKFSAHVCCGQMATWIKMPLGTQVGLGPGYIVLDGDPAPPKGGTAPSHFLPHDYCGQMAGWIKMPHGTVVDLGPGYIVLDGAQLPLPERDTAAPLFRAMSVVAKWSPISATAELLLPL